MPSSLQRTPDQSYDTHSYLIKAAALLYVLGQEEPANALLNRVPEEELKNRFRFEIVDYLVAANKCEEALVAAESDRGALFVLVRRASHCNTQIALRAAGKIGDTMARRDALLAIANAVLVSGTGDSKHPEVARQVMTLADGR